MNKFSFNVLYLLGVILAGTYAARSQEIGSSNVTLAYSTQASQPSRSALLRSPRGTAYQLTLVPDFDAGHHVVVLELFLRKPGKNTSSLNLLDPSGHVHGYQRYDFAASDFVNGAQKSRYGETRVVTLPRLGMEVLIKVTEVHVKPITENQVQGMEYQFGDLTLQINAQSPSNGVQH